MTHPKISTQKIIITGASRGIGKAIALCLAQKNTALFLHAHSQLDALAETAEHCRQLGAQQVEYTCSNLADEGNAEQLVHLADLQLGGITGLVHCAGITDDQLAIRMKDEQWHNVIKVNLDACFFLCRSALKIMLKQRYGRIVNISSVVTQHPSKGQANYITTILGKAVCQRPTIPKDLKGRLPCLSILDANYLASAAFSAFSAFLAFLTVLAFLALGASAAGAGAAAAAGAAGAALASALGASAAKAVVAAKAATIRAVNSLLIFVPSKIYVSFRHYW